MRLLTEPRHTLSINTSTPSQFAALAALTGPQTPVDEMLAEYAERRAYLMGALTDMGLTYGHPGGAFYIYTNVSSTGLNAEEFCEALLRNTGVLIFPGSLFGDDSGDYIRISYLQPLPQIQEAVARMATVYRRAKSGGIKAEDERRKTMDEAYHRLFVHLSSFVHRPQSIVPSTKEACMTTTPLRLLQVGLGNRGRMWNEVIARRADVIHSGAVDINPANLAEFTESHPDVPGFASLDEALSATESDAVLLVTPPDGHLVQARAVFAAGLPLLAEKPLTLEMSESVQIVDMAADAGLPLMVGLNFRYLPVSLKIRELVLSEALGTPGFGQFTYQRNRDGRQPRLNKYPLTMQHPMMLEQSIHHLDLIRYCYGREVERVSCRTWNPPWSMYAHDSNVSCLLQLEGGLEVNYLGTWTGGWDELQFQWRTDCSDGVIVQQQLFEDIAIARSKEKALTPVPLPDFQAFFDDTEALLGSFVSHVQRGTELECSGADHLRTLALCFAAIESSETGRTVEMADFYQRHGVRMD